MDCNQDVLLIFKQKLNELTEIAAKIPQDDKVTAREYFYANLNSLQNILDDHNDTDRNVGSKLSTNNYVVKTNSLNNSSSCIDTGKTVIHQNTFLVSQQDDACNLLNIRGVQSEQDHEDVCDKFYQQESQIDSICSSQTETHSETFDCSASLSGENVNISPINSSVKYVDIDEDKNHAAEAMPETNETISHEIDTLPNEDSKNCPIQDKNIVQVINGSTSALQDSIQMQVTACTSTSQSDLNDTTMSTADCLPEINQDTLLGSRNVTVLKEEGSSDEFLILKIELEDGTVQDFKVPSDLVEEKSEKEYNDDNISPIQTTSQAVEDKISGNSGTTLKEPAIIRMNLRDRPKLTFAQKQKGPGRPKNENIPKPKLNSRGEPVYICDVCLTSVKTYHALLVHMRTHTGSRPFCCNLCSKSFTTKGNLKAHSVTHSDDKPWKCQFCTKVFKEKKVLKTHERIHTGEKPFSCSICNRAFNQRSTLLEHILTHSNTRPHLCDICGQGFRGASSLKSHKKRHLGMREFQCSTCNKAFVCKNELTRHNLTHSGDRPFSCQLCTKSFTRMAYLKEHMNLHSGAKPYVCLDCGDAFSESMSLSRHKRKHLSKTENKSDFDQSMILEYTDKSNASVIIEQENYYTTAVSEQTVLNEGQTLIQVLSDDSTKVEYFQKLRSLLISAANNDCMSNVDTSKQLYQVLCVNPDTQEVVSQGEGHQVIVEGHSDDVTTMNILSNNNMQHFTI